MENKNYIWRPVSEYTGGRVLATNGLDVIIGEINSEGDCESEEDGSTILCGITGFIKIEEMLPKLKESEGERIRKAIYNCVKWFGFDSCFFKDVSQEECLAWLEKQGEHANFRNKIQIGDKVTRNEDGVLVNLSQLNRVAKKDEKQCEQKPAWSEEDKRIILAVSQLLKDCESENGWNCVYSNDREVFFADIENYLQSLKNRIVPQPKQEWSEEDELIVAKILCICDDFAKSFEISPASTKVIKEDVDKIDNWLKSLKDKYTWKPSEEQIKSLEEVINEGHFTSYPNALETLYEQLKNL